MTTPPALPRTPEGWIALAVVELAGEPDRLGHPTIYLHTLAHSLGVWKSPEVTTAARWMMVLVARWANPAMIPLRAAFEEIGAAHPVP